LGYSFKAKHSGKCLDVNGPLTADGNPALRQYTCDRSAAQLFVVGIDATGAQRLELTSSPTCADLERSYTYDGAAIIMYPCHNDPNQKWYSTPTAANYFTLSNLDSNKCLSVSDGALTDHAMIVQWSCDQPLRSEWERIPIYK
jgi:hypothetical protein